MKKQLIKPKELSDVLITYQKERGLTHRNLAKFIGVPEFTLWRWKNNTVKISPMMYLRLQQLKIL